MYASYPLYVYCSDLRQAFPLSGLWFLMVYCLFTGFTNQFHKWSHNRNPPALVKLLQDCRVIVSYKEHQRHHRGDYTEAFCLTNGMCNGFLELIGFWRAITPEKRE